MSSPRAMTVDELDTPFLLVDLDTVDENISTMQSYCNRHGLALRPHVKTHKTPLIAALQVSAGAIGVTCQKIGEAEVMVEHECADDILITFPLVGAAKAARFAELASKASLSVGADSAVVARELSAALEERGARAGFLVDCDCGFRRTGVGSPSAAAELAALVDSLPALDFRGLMTHPTRRECGPWLKDAKRRIEANGIAVECVSSGGTPESMWTHEVSEITELRVGTYVYRDRRTTMSASFADCALRVRSMVVSAPAPGRVILDAGSKTLTSDPGPRDGLGSFGVILEYEDAVIHQLSEEHGHVDVGACRRPPEIGEVVTIVPNHACATVNVHAEAALHRGGRDVQIVPVAARGRIR